MPHRDGPDGALEGRYEAVVCRIRMVLDADRQQTPWKPPTGSGVRTSVHLAVELRDGGPARFSGVELSAPRGTATAGVHLAKRRHRYGVNDRPQPLLHVLWHTP
jgi:hypothetical protein